MAVKKIPLPPGGTGPVLLFLVFLLPLGAEPFYSPTWGFRIDPPEGYTYTGGDGKTRFSFSSGAGGTLDLAIYPGGAYPSVEALARDGQKRLNSRGDMSVFTYGHKNAVLVRLDFSVPGAPSPGAYTGWVLCVELDPPGEAGANRGTPMLLALAYGRGGNPRGLPE